MSKGDRNRVTDRNSYRETYDRVFGEKEFKDRKYTIVYTNEGSMEIEGNNLVFKDKPVITDNPNHKQLCKIGKEIERYKKLDGLNKHGIAKRFSTDADKLFVKPIDKTLVKQIARDVCRGLKGK